ncbi:hypothetical protein DMUE_2865 [Dictyocoela muelleri]|nr:hypothetical protein DMUE_2865 [Dictyocoela muelleri]
MATNKKIKNNSRDKGKIVEGLKISKSKKEPRHRNWLFTSYDEKLLYRIEKIAQNHEYLLMYLEKREEDGRLHYQGLLVNKNAKSMTRLKKIFNDNTIQFEIVNNLRDAFLFCNKRSTKAEERFEFSVKTKTTIQDKIYADYHKKITRNVLYETRYTQ